MEVREAEATCDWRKNWRHVRLPMSLLIAAMISEPLLEWFGADYGLGSPARVALMLAPMLLYSAGAVTFALSMRKMDELHRRVHLQSATVGFVAALVAGFLLDGLTHAGLLRAAPADAGAVGLIAWVAALFTITRRYQLGRWAPRQL